MSGEAEDGMSATDAEALNRETEGHRKTHYTKLRELRSKLSNRKPVKEEKPVIVAGHDGAARTVETKKQPAKINALDCPTWDGMGSTGLFPGLKPCELKTWLQDMITQDYNTCCATVFQIVCWTTYQPFLHQHMISGTIWTKSMGNQK